MLKCCTHKKKQLKNPLNGFKMVIKEHDDASFVFTVTKLRMKDCDDAFDAFKSRHNFILFIKKDPKKNVRNTMEKKTLNQLDIIQYVHNKIRNCFDSTIDLKTKYTFSFSTL